MSARRGAVAVVLAFLARSASADPGDVRGFFTTGPGELEGSVTRDDGAAALGVEVHVVSASGDDRVVTTDKHGTFRVALDGGGQTHVFIREPWRITGTTTAGSEDAIEMRDILAPATQAIPRRNPAWIPPYSDEAIDADTWTRAWLMLEIDTAGRVAHVKLLTQAGLGLDEIAVREAFALRFEPARDRAKRPIRSLALWTFEWPPYWWMSIEQRTLSRLPAEVLKTTCRPGDQTTKHLRDCRAPDLSRAEKLPWLARKRR